MFSGAEIRPHSQWNLCDFFPNFEGEKSQSSKNIFFLFFVEDLGFHSVNTHTSHMVMFSFKLMAIVYLANLFFLLTKNDIIVHYNKIPNITMLLFPI